MAATLGAQRARHRIANILQAALLNTLFRLRIGIRIRILTVRGLDSLLAWVQQIRRADTKKDLLDFLLSAFAVLVAVFAKCHFELHVSLARAQKLFVFLKV